jgi:deoxyribose-phosphate aldolase
MNIDFDVYDGKTFSDLCKDVIDRSESKKNQLDILFSDIRGHIKNINDAQVFIPRIKELLDTGIKNDEQLIKLASVVQRLHSTQIETSGVDSVGLTEEEKDQLLQSLAEEKVKEIKKEVDSPLLLSTSSIK